MRRGKRGEESEKRKARMGKREEESEERKRGEKAREESVERRASRGKRGEKARRGEPPHVVWAVHGPLHGRDVARVVSRHVDARLEHPVEQRHRHLTPSPR